MKRTLLLIVIMLVASINHIYAHALWIETNFVGKKDKVQDVKLFYGEYATNERENTSKWYSDEGLCFMAH